VIRKIVRIMFLVAGTIGSAYGYIVLTSKVSLFSDIPSDMRIVGAVGAIGGLIGFMIAPVVIKAISDILHWTEAKLQRTPTQDLILGAIGLTIGLIIGTLIGLTLRNIPLIGPFLPVIADMIFGSLGILVAVRKKEELSNLFSFFPRSVERVASGKDRSGRMNFKSHYKILDTSVIIDGRIADICDSGFLEGILLVPGFVIEELQHIADASDVLKRNRGRRGLDILNKMQKTPQIIVQIYEKNFPDVFEVDSKLVRLAKELNAKVVTNDYNLNKVAELHGVPVLNINELANALKPVVLPGEEMVVQVIKDGKEIGQGVAYLDDGTMIVVDGGRKYIGEQVGVMVTSVLQTAAGRMIFAKPKGIEKAL
jgi:uncharacterized protein YacL